MSESMNMIEKVMNANIFHPPHRRQDDSVDYITRTKKEDGAPIKVAYFVLHPEPPKTIKKKYGDDHKNNSDLPYLVWNHGNACDIQEIRMNMENMFERMGRNIGIIAYDYEGYGYSSGVCRESNCYRDLEIVIDFCTDDLGISKNRLFLVGQSLGTGVVIDYVCNHNWKTPIILFSPYKTISRVIYDPSIFNVGMYLTVNAVDRFRSIDKIGQIDAPIIIYHGVKDRLIEFYHALELQKTNPQNTTVILIREADHNDILSHVDFREIWNVVFNHLNN